MSEPAAADANTARPLDGIQVLDFTHAAAGPYLTMQLADLGATVIKIEKPGRGDGSRHMGQPMLGPLESDYYLGINRNKRSVLLDLSKPEGAEIARQLAARSDIVAQNFRPGVMDRLGLGFEQLRDLRPNLVYTSISAFGPSGPWRDRPANDIVMQSVSGLMGITGEVGGAPVRIGAPICDFSTGLFALSGTLAALYARDAHPRGQHVEVAMLDAALAMMANYIPSVVDLGLRIERLGRGHSQLVPYQAFVCSDGAYVMVGAFTSGFWRRLCRMVGHEDWVEDPRFLTNADRLEHRDELLAELAEIFRQRPRAEWLARLDEADVPNSPVLELDEAVHLDQVRHNGAIRTVRSEHGDVSMAMSPIRTDSWDDQPVSVPPRMGEHTREVLLDQLGIDETRLGRLAAEGVVGTWEGAA